MPERVLEGVGVLITRPRRQSAELADAVSKLGGRPIEFPVIEPRPRSAADVATTAAGLAEPDLVIFVSANAVRFGIDYAAAKVAAIGPATAASFTVAAPV